jgi:hypothetical protein
MCGSLSQALWQLSGAKVAKTSALGQLLGIKVWQPSVYDVVTDSVKSTLSKRRKKRRQGVTTYQFQQ